MSIISLGDLGEASSLPEGAVLALGNFDGFHLGHRAIVSAAVGIAARTGKACAIWTFSSLAKSSPVPCLTSQGEKLALFASSGADFAVFEDFASVRDMSCDDFVTDILIGKLRCSAVVCGFNFRFGKAASGDSALLEELMARRGRAAHVVEPVKLELHGEARLVSSTAIRQYLAEGDAESAAAMLGHPFTVSAAVLSGKQLGRVIGYPTVNQRFDGGRIVPKHGIYASKVVIDGEVYYGVTNVGIRPTVESGAAVNAETHIFGYSGDLYGRTLSVMLMKYLRCEEKFSSVDELRRAIGGDIEASRRYFGL